MRKIGPGKTFFDAKSGPGSDQSLAFKISPGCQNRSGCRFVKVVYCMGGNDNTVKAFPHKPHYGQLDPLTTMRIDPVLPVPIFT